MNQKESLQKLIDQSNKLAEQMSKTHEFLLQSRRFETPGKKMFLEGSFQGFNEQQQALAIHLEGHIYHYPISFYNGARLPEKYADVLIGVDQKKDEPSIIGYQDKGLQIEAAPLMVFKLQAINHSNNRVYLRSENQLLKLNIPQSMPVLEQMAAHSSYVFKLISYKNHMYYIPVSEQGEARQVVDILRMIR